MTNWYDKYLHAPYKHLGNSLTQGIDCYNLCRLVIEEQTGVTIPAQSSDYCNVVDEDWYNKSRVPVIKNAVENDRWIKITKPRKFCIITMIIGGSNMTNHCALFLGEKNKMLQITVGHQSWVSTYGRYYQQYTQGIYLWEDLLN